MVLAQPPLEEHPRRVVCPGRALPPCPDRLRARPAPVSRAARPGCRRARGASDPLCQPHPEFTAGHLQADALNHVRLLRRARRGILNGLVFDAASVDAGVSAARDSYSSLPRCALDPAPTTMPSSVHAGKTKRARKFRTCARVLSTSQFSASKNLRDRCRATRSEIASRRPDGGENVRKIASGEQARVVRLPSRGRC